MKRFAHNKKAMITAYDRARPGNRFVKNENELQDTKTTTVILGPTFTPIIAHRWVLSVAAQHAVRAYLRSSPPAIHRPPSLVLPSRVIQQHQVHTYTSIFRFH